MRFVRVVAAIIGAATLAVASASCGVGDPQRPETASARSTTAPSTTPSAQDRRPHGDRHDRSGGRTGAGDDRGDGLEAPAAPASGSGGARPAADHPGEIEVAASAAPAAPTSPPEAASPAATLADDLTHLETALRAPETPEARVAVLAHRQQVDYRELALHPSWVRPVLDALPARLRDDALAQVAARQEFLDMSSAASLNEGPPAGWAVAAPAPEADLLRWYQGAGAEYGVDWTVLAAINLVETGMGRIRADSSVGAEGPMQFMPGTWARWGHGDVHDPHHAIYGAARYLAASGAAAGRLDDAVFAYNNDNRYVRAVKGYAGIMARNPILFRAFYHWQVYYRSTAGDLLLPEGYPQVPARPRP